MLALAPNDERLLAAAVVLAAYLAFCGAIAWRERRRGSRWTHSLIGGRADAVPTLVAFASQTGRPNDQRKPADTLSLLCVASRLPNSPLRASKYR